MFFSPSRAKTTWTQLSQAPISPLPLTQKTPFCPARQPLPSLPPFYSRHSILQTPMTQNLLSWRCWAYPCCWLGLQSSWQCAGPLNRMGTLRQAVVQGRAWLVEEVGPVSLSSRCGGGWAHIGVHTASPSDVRHIAGHMSVRAHTCPSHQSDRHHSQKPAQSLTSLCHVYLTMSLKSDLRTDWGLTDSFKLPIVYFIVGAANITNMWCDCTWKNF